MHGLSVSGPIATNRKTGTGCRCVGRENHFSFFKACHSVDNPFAGRINNMCQMTITCSPFSCLLASPLRRFFALPCWIVEVANLRGLSSMKRPRNLGECPQDYISEFRPFPDFRRNGRNPVLRMKHSGQSHQQLLRLNSTIGELLFHLNSFGC